jgi:hypothetical protein
VGAAFAWQLPLLPCAPLAVAAYTVSRQGDFVTNSTQCCCRAWRWCPLGRLLSMCTCSGPQHSTAVWHTSRLKQLLLLLHIAVTAAAELRGLSQHLMFVTSFNFQ